MGIRAVKEPMKILEDIMGAMNRSDQYSVCSDSEGLLYFYNYFLDTLKEIHVRQRAGKHTGIRWVTNIEEIPDVMLMDVIKTFLDLGIRIRHVKNVPPMSFGVSEKELAIIVQSMGDGSLNAHAIFSNEPDFVEQFAVLFQELWKRGIDAQNRIEEVESQGKTFIDIIQGPTDVLKKYRALVTSARQQILLFLPTINEYKREVRIGILKLLQEASARGVDIRVLLPSDNELEEKIPERIEFKKGFAIRKINTGIPTEARSKICVIDARQYLVVELRDDSKDTFPEAVGSAILSNSKSTILSYITMFDSLWRQSELYEKLEDHDRIQREFINVVAHELRTPTQSILGFSELLQDSQGEDSAEMLNSLIRNAYRLQALITDILDVARIESGTLKLENENIKLSDLITTSMTEAESQVKASGRQIEISYSHIQQQRLENKDIIIYADKDRTSQVLFNILNNAIKFTKKGKIDIIAIEEYNRVLIKIKDSGSGIDPQVFPKLFEKFVSKSQKGTGLGLFISKKIIEAQGGTIWAENNSDGKGATFTFTLPLAA